MEPIYDVLIVGCGAVGSAVAREMSLLGKSCVVIEKNSKVLSEASSGNTGHLARNFYYTSERAPLEFQMTRRAATFHNENWLSSQPNIPRRKCGLLFLARNDDQLEDLKKLETLGKENGENVRIISLEELKEIEPNLCHENVISALLSPQEYVIDPYLLPLSNLFTALTHGCKVLTETEVIGADWDSDKYCWNVLTKTDQNSDTFLQAKAVINCAGNYSDEVNQLNTSTENFRITPGKGIFGVFECIGGRGDVRSMVVPVPTKNFAGVYIFKSVYNHVVVGPTNVRQESKTDRNCDHDTLESLKSHLEEMFPHAQWKLITSYAGLRPASPDSDDYLIKMNLEKSWITLGAIRSTGLTASRALAEYVAQNLFPNENHVKEDVTMPSPQVEADGRIRIGKRVFEPTHKLSQLGIFKS